MNEFPVGVAASDSNPKGLMYFRVNAAVHLHGAKRFSSRKRSEKAIGRVADPFLNAFNWKIS